MTLSDIEANRSPHLLQPPRRHDLKRESLTDIEMGGLASSSKTENAEHGLFW
jgi:hypothetical protein